MVLMMKMTGVFEYIQIKKVMMTGRVFEEIL
jgi:hypothetical protein